MSGELRYRFDPKAFYPATDRGNGIAHTRKPVPIRTKDIEEDGRLYSVSEIQNGDTETKAKQRTRQLLDVIWKKRTRIDCMSRLGKDHPEFLAGLGRFTIAVFSSINLPLLLAPRSHKIPELFPRTCLDSCLATPSFSSFSIQLDKVLFSDFASATSFAFRILSIFSEIVVSFSPSQGRMLNPA